MNATGQRGSKAMEIIRVLQSRRLKKGRDALMENKGKELGKPARDYGC